MIRDFRRRRRKLKKFLLKLVVILLACGSASAATYYRYENEDGFKVMTQTMPPQFVHKGYEVLNQSGRVVKVVPPALTSEQREALQLEEQKRQSISQQLAHDKRLLAIFSGPEDAERARERKLEAIDVYINVTRGNINKLRDEYNQAQAKAAAKERGGQEVPDYLVTNMESIERQILDAEGSIVEKEQEKEVIRAEYEEDIERLRYLLQRQKEGHALGQRENP